MLGTQDLLLFITSGLLLNLTPGADSLFIATRSAQLGWRVGAAAALGVSAGCLVHVLLAALGLSALLATSALAFQVLTVLGAGYLVWMGIDLWRRVLHNKSPSSHPAHGTHEEASRDGPRSPPPSTAPIASTFVQGLMTNVLNPKVALFFLAFVPQFISASAPSKPLAFLFLGLVFTTGSLLWCLVLAGLGSRAGAWGLNPRISQVLTRLCGVAFVGLGLRLLWGVWSPLRST